MLTSLREDTDLVCLSGDEITLCTHVQILDAVADNADIDKEYLTICSAATNNQTIDLTDATFYRTYNTETHAIEVYPKLSKESITVVDPDENSVHEARRIAGTPYFITLDDKQIRTNPTPIEDRYCKALFDRFGVLLPHGHALHFSINNKTYLLQYTTLDNALPGILIEQCDGKYIYDIVSGKTLDDIISELQHLFKGKALDYLNRTKEQHALDIQNEWTRQRWFDKRLEHYSNTIAAKIRNGTIYAIDSDFVKEQIGKRNPIMDLKTELDDLIDNDLKITMTLGISVRQSDSYYDRRAKEFASTPYLIIQASYKNEKLVQIKIKDEFVYRERLYYNVCPALTGEMALQSSNDKLSLPKIPITRDECKSIKILDHDDYTPTTYLEEANADCDKIAFIKNAIISAKSRIERKTKAPKLNTYKHGSDTIMYAYVNFGEIPGLLTFYDGKCRFYTSSFETRTDLYGQSTALRSILGQFSNMTETQRKNYIMDYIDKNIYKIDATASAFAKFVESYFRKTDAEYTHKAYYASDASVHGKNGNIFCRYNDSAFIVCATDGTIIQPVNIPDKNSYACVRLFDTDQDTKNSCDVVANITANAFNKLDIKRQHFYPTYVQLSSPDMLLYNEIRADDCDTLTENAEKILTTLRSTRDVIGGCKRERIEMAENDTVIVKDIELRATDDELYLLKLTEFKKDPRITIELSTRKYDSKDRTVRCSMTIEKESANKADSDIISLIVENMLKSISLFS